jgi:hypothetical protein
VGNRSVLHRGRDRPVVDELVGPSPEHFAALVPGGRPGHRRRRSGDDQRARWHLRPRVRAAMMPERNKAEGMRRATGARRPSRPGSSRVCWWEAHGLPVHTRSLSGRPVRRRPLREEPEHERAGPPRTVCGHDQPSRARHVITQCRTDFGGAASLLGSSRFGRHRSRPGGPGFAGGGPGPLRFERRGRTGGHTGHRLHWMRPRPCERLSGGRGAATKLPAGTADAFESSVRNRKEVDRLAV